MAKKRGLRSRSTDPQRVLEPQELRLGAIHCFENAQDLLEEARLLLANKSFARTCALAAVGFEELSKARVCAGLLANDPDLATFQRREIFWDFWNSHVEKGTRVFLRTAQDGPNPYRPSDVETAERLGKSLKDLRELALYVDVRENHPPEDQDAVPMFGKWPVKFRPPRDMVTLRSAQAIVRDLGSYIEDLSPRIVLLRKGRAEDNRSLADGFNKTWREMQRRPVRTVADFPDKPNRGFGIKVYGLHNPFLLRTLSAHYGVPVGDWNVKAGEEEHTLTRALEDLHAADLGLFVWGPGHVLINVTTSTDRATLPEPRPNDFGIAFSVVPQKPRSN
jgi:AbiV family abortive infection protein